MVGAAIASSKTAAMAVRSQHSRIMAAGEWPACRRACAPARTYLWSSRVSAKADCRTVLGIRGTGKCTRKGWKWHLTPPAPSARGLGPVMSWPRLPGQRANVVPSRLWVGPPFLSMLSALWCRALGAGPPLESLLTPIIVPVLGLSTHFHQRLMCILTPTDCIDVWVSGAIATPGYHRSTPESRVGSLYNAPHLLCLAYA